MKRDLSDVEVASVLGKHRRTIQRWCAAGKLPGAYKAGRSWRIPAGALRRLSLAEALRGDDIERDLELAIATCKEIRGELDALRRYRTAPPQRNWRAIARRLERLQDTLEELPKLARHVPSEYDGWGARAAPDDRARPAHPPI